MKNVINDYKIIMIIIIRKKQKNQIFEIEEETLKIFKMKEKDALREQIKYYIMGQILNLYQIY